MKWNKRFAGCYFSQDGEYRVSKLRGEKYWRACKKQYTNDYGEVSYTTLWDSCLTKKEACQICEEEYNEIA